MAVLEKIRVKFGLAISIIIALALLSFIIDPNTLETALHSMSSKYDVGNIAGKSVSYSDFQEEVDKFTRINEIMSGTSVQDSETQKQIRDAAWQSFIDKYMFLKNAKAAGINVGSDEMLDLTTGDNISPVLIQSGIFSDQNGEFSSELLVNFVQQLESDQTGQFRAFWDYLQNSIYTQQYYTKYASLFSTANMTNALQLKENLYYNNTTADVDYVNVNYPFSRDSSIVVSDKEIKDYYNKHKESYKQKANRDIEYVVYEVVPSNDDIEAANEAIADAYDEFQSTDNMKAFLLKNSDRALNDYWYKAGELRTISASLNDQIFEVNQKVTPILKEGNTFYAARVMESAMISDSVYVKHILLQGEKAASTADSLLTLVKRGANFANLAVQHSMDQGSMANNEMGSIGWMTQNYMIPGFESVISANVGQPFILNTQYGTHVVLVSQKTKPVAKKKVAILEKSAISSKETFNKYYADANRFASIANGTYEGYKKALDSTKVYSHKLKVTEATSNYGAVDQAKEITRWVFDNKPGKASNIITVNNNYFFVVCVKDAQKEGYAPLQTVSSSIKEILYTEKLQDKYSTEVKEKVKGLSSMEEIAEALDVQVQSQEDLSLSSNMMEPTLLGLIASSPEGVISEPTAGVIGVYIVKVNAKHDNSFYTEEDSKMYEAQKAQYKTQQLVPAMMNLADVVDNRERFY